MPENWDDILGEPIASLGDPAAALSLEAGAEGMDGAQHWLAVQPLASISPRQQDAPVTMPEASSMVRLHLPLQPETDAVSAKLPPSLAEQLSLTWAAKRRHNLEPEAEPLPAPRPVQSRGASEVERAPLAASPAAPVWRRPFEAIARVFARSQHPTQPGPPHESPSPTTMQPAELTTDARVTAPSPGAPSARRAQYTLIDQGQTPRPEAGLQPDISLTLATPHRAQSATDLSVEPGNASLGPATPPANDVPLSQTSVVRQALAGEARVPALPPRSGGNEMNVSAERPSGETASLTAPAPDSLPSPAPRRGLLSWLLPKRAQGTAHAGEAPPAPLPTGTAAPAAQVPASSTTARQDAPLERAVVQSDQPSAQVGDALRSDGDEARWAGGEEPGLSTGMSLTHRVLSPGREESDEPETLRETLGRLAESGPAGTPPLQTDEPGEPLPALLRERMEGLLDVPLHEVRIFRGQVSQRLTRAMQADAVTVGNQVHFAGGKGDSSLPAGRALIAHELAHYASHRPDGDNSAEMGVSRGKAPWPSLPSMEPDPAAPSQDAEESLALRLERAVSPPATFDAPPVAPGQLGSAQPPLSLQHRAQVPPVIVASGGVPGHAFASEASGFAGDGGFSAAADGGGMGSFGGSAGVGTAPEDRMVGEDDSAAPPAEAAAAAADTKGKDNEEAEGKVEQLVDAVLKRIAEDEGLDSERRGAFRARTGGW